jgi:methylenetetrahydrofolate reductase (NADPH)
MQISEFFSRPGPVFSFEFFPPKNVEAFGKLIDTVRYLAELRPDFVSVTYGAGGGTRHLTHDLVTRIKREAGLEAMAHLTCVGHSRSEIEEIVRKLTDEGVDNLLCLRGDPPAHQEEFIVAENGFAHANDLMDHVGRQFQVCIAGACYPEAHPESESLDSDIKYAKAKVDAGASFLVTQLFFDNRHYFEFVAKARAAGISVPILPGIMPVTNAAQIEKFISRIGATIPESLLQRLNRFREDDQAVMATGIEWATRQCKELLAGGAPGIHFYTLNKSLATRVVFANLRNF